MFLDSFFKFDILYYGYGHYYYGSNLVTEICPTDSFGSDDLMTIQYCISDMVLIHYGEHPKMAAYLFLHNLFNMGIKLQRLMSRIR